MVHIPRARKIFLIWLLLGCSCLSAQAWAAGLPDLPESELTIQAADGQRYDFVVLLASTPAQTARGLMFVTEMDENQGMLFDFGETRPVSMWMRNTALPLDMLFIREDGTISNIAEQTVPYTRTPIVSAGPVRFVLELLGGSCQRLGIRAGDLVHHASVNNRETGVESPR
ncbi:MAG: DUF192 domain-containing protein [Gammaproteobacteria bacterium]